MLYGTLSISNFQNVLTAHSYLICEDRLELFKLPWVCIRLLKSSGGADAVIRPSDVDMPIFCSRCPGGSLCVPSRTPCPSVPVRRCPRCPSDSLSDRAIHTVPIMSNHRQVHISSEPSRTDIDQPNLSPLPYATFSLISHEGYQECPPPARLINNWIQCPCRSSSRDSLVYMASYVLHWSCGGLTPTQPLHTLGHHLRVEQCAVLL